jgi:very-short-patch-repair endonuclease
MKCKFCGKECKNKNSLVQHEIRCKSNSDHIIVKSPSKSQKWFEAMHNRRGHGSNQYTKAKELGLPKPEISEETKKKLSEKFSGDNNPAKREDVRNKISKTQKINYKGRSIFNIDRSQEPFSEKYFREWLEKERIDYKKNFHVDRFFLDFAFPDKKIYFEVNGEQHYRKMYNGRDYQERDKERECIISQCGWKCIATIRWSEFRALSSDERSAYLESLKRLII